MCRKYALKIQDVKGYLVGTVSKEVTVWSAVLHEALLDQVIFLGRNVKGNKKNLWKDL